APDGNGLFPLNSDETWIWCCDVQETGAVLDNSILTIAALTGITRWMASLLDERTTERANSLLETCVDALITKMIVPGKNLLAVAREDNGLLDESAITNPICRPFIMNIVESLPLVLQHAAMKSLVSCWNNCKTQVAENGIIIRSHSATAAMTGNSLGFALAALGHVNARAAGDTLLSGIMTFVNCTGSVNEIHDIFDPSWGTERRRLWDSASILQGIYQYILNTRVDGETIRFTPYCPSFITSISIDDYPVLDKHYSFRLAREHGILLCAIKENGIEIAKHGGLKEIIINRVDGRCTIANALIQDERFSLTKRTNEFWEMVQNSSSIQIVHETDAVFHAREVQRQVVFTRNIFPTLLDRQSWGKIKNV
nr:hypothetical protein [Candidatus Sigynarchaeota archaeon]